MRAARRSGGCLLGSPTLHSYGASVLPAMPCKPAMPSDSMGAAQELDVDTEMQRGMLPGAMALSAKFVPVVQRVSRKTLEAVKEFVADPKALTDKVWQEARNASPTLMSRPSNAAIHQCCQCCSRAHAMRASAEGVIPLKPPSELPHRST